MGWLELELEKWVMQLLANIPLIASSEIMYLYHFRTIMTASALNGSARAVMIQNSCILDYMKSLQAELS